jgi:transposase
MGVRLRVFLTSEQDKILLNLRTGDVPQKVKDRAEVIRLNAHGWYVEKIAAHFKWTPQTVREVLHKWQKLGLEGLRDKAWSRGKNKVERRGHRFFGRMPEKRTTYIQWSSISSEIRKRSPN